MLQIMFTLQFIMHVVSASVSGQQKNTLGLVTLYECIEGKITFGEYLNRILPCIPEI